MSNTYTKNRKWLNKLAVANERQVQGLSLIFEVLLAEVTPRIGNSKINSNCKERINYSS